MTSAANVGSDASQAGRDAKLRLFCGLRLPDGTADAIAAWQPNLGGRGRLVPRDHLHFTLAFLGWQPESRVAEVAAVLRRRCAQTAPPVFELVRYRETRSVGMLVFSRDEGAERLAFALQRDLLGEVERDHWLPHVTVCRFKAKPRGPAPPLPELGSVVTSEAAAYLSVLRAAGAEYVILESVRLGWD